MAQYWNPSDCSSLIILSTQNGNANAGAERSATSSGTWQSVRSVTSHSSGRWIFLTKCTDTSGTGSEDLISGFATSAMSLANYVGSDAFGWGLQSASSGAHCNIYHAGINYDSGFSGGQLLTSFNVHAIDIDAGKIWHGGFSIPISGPIAIQWYPSALGANVGNPATGTFPTNTFTPGTTIFAAASHNATPDSSTLYISSLDFFTVSTLTAALPSGFLPWAGQPSIDFRTIGTVTSLNHYWNPLDKSSLITLQSPHGRPNSGTQRSATSSGTEQSVRSVTSHNTGKWFFAAALSVQSAANADFVSGFATSAMNLSNYVGSDAFGWGNQASGDAIISHTYHNNVNSNQVVPPGVCYNVHAIDIDAGNMWFGYWDGTNPIVWYSSSDPVAETTPIYTFTPGTTIFLACSHEDYPAAGILYNSASDFALIGNIPIPSGYSIWG